jgi:hypothetical protein
MSKAPSGEANTSSLDLIYEEAKDQLAAQRELSRALDRKAELILGSASLIITVASGLKALRPTLAPVATATAPAGDPTLASLVSLALYALAAVFYLCAIAFGYRAYTVREFHKQVGPSRLREKYLPMEPDEAKTELLTNIIRSYGKNRTMIRSQKTPALKKGLIFLLLETLSLSIALVLSAF